MDLLDSLVSSDGRTCSQVLREMATNLLSSSQEQSLRQTHPHAIGSATMAEGPPPSAQPHQDENMPKSSYPLQPLGEFEIENPYTPKPKLVPIQGKATTETIPQFYQLCQLHGIQPVVTESEVYKGAFTAKVVFGTKVEEVTYPYSSKRAAREAVCKLAIARLPSIENAQKVGTKRKVSYTDEVVPQLDTSENWIGILLGKLSPF